MVHGKTLSTRRRNLFGACWSLIILTLLGALPALSATTGADAIVLVNSTSAKYSDFPHLIQPYLDNFGVPYTVLDIATNNSTTNLSDHALVIIGHKQLDTNHIRFDTNAQANISNAISNGVGLVNFDSDLSVGTSPRYQFIQDIFGFSYTTAVTVASVTLPPTEPSSKMHYITALHQANETISFRTGITLPGIISTNATSVLLSNGRPLLAIKKYGLGRAAQWTSYDWIPTDVLGPQEGMDDTIWRSLVWAARKPFVMRGLPNLVTMRVDDCEGPFWWAQMAIDAGFRPYLAVFLSSINSANTADLRRMVTNGNATTSIHSFSSSTMFYFDHLHETSYSDSAISNNFYIGTRWHATNGIPISKVVQTHYSEIGPNAFAGLQQWGVEFIPIEVVPGSVEYGANPAPWLVAGPYRYFETPGQGQSTLPLFYADFLTIPGHPELAGKFFDCYTEIRDASSCGEWCPDTGDVSTVIARGTDMLKRSMNSLVLPTLFTHEWYIHPTSCCGSTTILSNNWRAILSGITNNLASYKPMYVTLDYGNQYVRATRTSRITSSQFDSISGQVNVSLSGYADLDTSVNVFVGADNSISNDVGTIGAFTNTVTVTAATVSMPPTILVPPTGHTNHAGTTADFAVDAGGTSLVFQWLKNTADISQATNSVLLLPAVSPSDAASYAVIVSNNFGAVTSSPATLTVVAPLIINSIQVSNGLASLNWNAIPGNNYSLQTNSSPEQTNWNARSVLQATGNTATASDSILDSTQRFYRVFLLP